MIKNFWISLVAICLQGCIADIQLVVNDQVLQPTQSIKLNVASVQIINKAKIDAKHTYGFAVDLENPLPEQVQSQFHKAIVGLLENLIFPSQEGDNIAVVHIDEASITLTHSGAKNIPFVGIAVLAAGYKESYIATIKGVIEIENNSGQVLRSASFNVKSIVKDKTGVIEEINRGTKRANEKALQALEQQIVSQVHRYLYEYIHGKEN